MGLSPFGAVKQGLGKLFFWHLAQPASYFVVFACAVQAGELDGLQLWLGGFVAGREALYTLMVVACTWVKPTFLLVDVGASVREDTENDGFNGGYGFLAMYVVAPEKFVSLALLGARYYLSGGFLIMLGGGLLDLCGLAALGAGLAAGSLPLALAIGYSVTALGVLWMVGLALANGDKEGVIMMFGLGLTVFFVGSLLADEDGRDGRPCVLRAAGVPGAARARAVGVVNKTAV